MISLHRLNDYALYEVEEKIKNLTKEIKKGTHGVLHTKNAINEIKQYARKEEYIQEIKIKNKIDEDKIFTSRIEMGEYLNEIVGDKYSNFINDKGFWAWVSLIYLDQLCERKGDDYLLGSYYRYIYLNNSTRDYRHLTRSACLVYKQYPLAHKLFLKGQIYQSGDLMHKLSDDHLFSSNGFIEMCLKYFYIEDKNRFKKGFTANSSRAPGSFRRLVSVVSKQLKKNYDFFIMDAEAIYALLPNDFKV